jgi:hypothetical protein
LRARFEHVRWCRYEGPIALALSAALVWLAQFHHLRDFGLYEDDYFFISEAMGKDASYLVSRFHTAFTLLPQGRPFGFFLPDLFSFVGDKLGGLPAIYVLGFVVVSSNTFLCYWLLRSRLPVAPAVAGAGVFCLFPADTTRILLTHDFQLQPSLTFALVSALAYVNAASLRLGGETTRQAKPTPRAIAALPASGRRLRVLTYLSAGGGALLTEIAKRCALRVVAYVPAAGARLTRITKRGTLLALAYVFATGALLTYESGFLALVALPLFALPWDRRLRRRLLQHVVILLVVVVCVVALRFVVGERRALSSAGGLADIVPPLLGSLVLGPARSLAGMVYGPVRALPGWDGETVLVAAIAFAACLVLLWMHAGTGGRQLNAQIQTIGAGVAMLIAGYALAFTHFPPNALVGRGTSVHLGATLGMAVLAAGGAWVVLSAYPRIGTALLAGYVALAAGYYVTIERDFMRSWQLQRAFWQQVVACCSDVSDGTVLLYTLNPADEPTFIFTNSWSDPLVLGETFRFPVSWSREPRLFSLTEWQSRVSLDPAGGLQWWVPGASWDEHWEPLPQGNVIVLSRAPDGSLRRETGDVTVAGQRLALKAPTAPTAWPPAQLHDPLLR